MDNLEQLKIFIQKIAKKTLGNSVQDTLVSGIITKSIVQDNNGNIVAGYMVQPQDRNNPVFATAIGEKTFSINDNVYLINSVINGVTTYHIFDLVASTDHSFKIASEYDRFIKDLNGGKKIDITGSVDFSKEQSNILATLTLEKDTVMFTNINQYGYFDILGNFALSLTLENIVDYGIEIVLYDIQLDEKTKVRGPNKNILESFFLNSHYFIGQPYKAGQDVQHRFIQINGKNKGKIKTIQLFVYAKKDNRQDGKIPILTVSNVELSTGHIADQENRFSLNVDAADGKWHIDKPAEGKPAETVKLSAAGYYLTQELSTDVLQYFWFIKDESIKEDSEMVAGQEGFNPLAGAGWRCLTKFSWAEKVTTKSATEETRETTSIKLWNADSPTFTFSTDTLTSFENVVKCIAVYQNSLSIESKKLLLYNYNYETYEGYIDQPLNKTLFTKDDKLELVCNITNKNFLSNNNTFIYKWFVTNEQNTDVKEVVGDNDKFIVQQEMSIKDSESKIIFKEGFITVDCEVYISGIETLIYSTKESGHSVVCESLIKNIEDNSSFRIDTVYQFWFADENNCEATSEKHTEEGTNFQYKRWILKQNDVVLKIIDGDPKDDNVLANACTKEGFSNGTKKYIYYNSQQLIKLNENIQNKQDWTEPTIIRYIEYNANGFDGDPNKKIKDLYSEIAVIQLNTFNSLTNNGKSQGIFFQQREGGEPEDKDLYINASYIKTGALTVENDAGLIFQAGWDIGPDGGPVVKIAGFDVTRSKITNENTATSPEEQVWFSGIDGIKVGSFIEFGPNTGGRIQSGDFAKGETEIWYL